MPLSDVLVVEVAFDDLPNEPSPTWQPITEHVIEGNIDRGRSGVFDLYGTGRMEVHVNNGDPNHGAWLDLGGWYRHRQIRARYVGDGADAAVFTGYVDDVDHNADDAPFRGSVKISAQDATGVFSNLDLDGTTDSYGPHDDFPFVGVIENFVYDAIARVAIPVEFHTQRFCTQAFQAVDENQTGNVWQRLLDALEAEHGTVQISAEGELCLNGRWTPWLGFIDGVLTSTLAFVDTNVDAALGRYAYRRENLTFAKPGSQYRNDITAKSKWLGTNPVHISNVPDGYPSESLSRTDLGFIHQPWVAADAALWANIYASTATFPQLMSFLLWAGETLLPIGSDNTNHLADKIVAATNRLGVVNIAVEYTAPGAGLSTFLVTPEAVRYEFNQAQFSARVGFSSRDAWNDAYPLDAGLVTIDGDPEHGIDSEAIIAP